MGVCGGIAAGGGLRGPGESRNAWGSRPWVRRKPWGLRRSWGRRPWRGGRGDVVRGAAAGHGGAGHRGAWCGRAHASLLVRRRRELLAKRASDEERAPLSQDVAPSPAPEAPAAEPGPRRAGSAKRASDGAKLMAPDTPGRDEMPRAVAGSPDASPAAVSPQTLGASAER